MGTPASLGSPSAQLLCTKQSVPGCPWLSLGVPGGSPGRLTCDTRNNEYLRNRASPPLQHVNLSIPHHPPSPQALASCFARSRSATPRIRPRRPERPRPEWPNAPMPTRSWPAVTRLRSSLDYPHAQPPSALFNQPPSSTCPPASDYSCSATVRHCGSNPATCPDLVPSRPSALSLLRTLHTARLLSCPAITCVIRILTDRPDRAIVKSTTRLYPTICGRPSTLIKQS